MVVTTEVEGSPSPEESVEVTNNHLARLQREKISAIRDSIWGLNSSRGLKWLFITDSDANLEHEDWKRRLLWQLFCRFDVGRDLHFDETGTRVAWDATVPIPSDDGPLPFEDGLLSPSMIQRWLVELMRGFPRGFEMGAREVLEFVKVEHTLFSLPFVLIGLYLRTKSLVAISQMVFGLFLLLLEHVGSQWYLIEL